MGDHRWSNVPRKRKGLCGKATRQYRGAWYCYVINSLHASFHFFTDKLHSIYLYSPAKCNEASEYMALEVPQTYSAEDLAELLQNQVRYLKLS